MKLSLVALCLSVSVKVISGAYQIPNTIKAFKQIITDFHKILDEGFQHDSRGPADSVPDAREMPPEMGVWFAAKYYGTCWQVGYSFLWLKDLSTFLPSITLADNPVFLEYLTPEVYQMVMKPDNLAIYDAVNLAATLPNLDVFANIHLQMFNAKRIIKLQERRKELNFNLPLAIQHNDVGTLGRYIANKVWIPTIDDFCAAVKANESKRLLLLSKVENTVPCVQYLNRLGDNVLDYIRLLNIDWKPSQDDVKCAILNRFEVALKFYVSVDPEMLSSVTALLLGRLQGTQNIFQAGQEVWVQLLTDELKEHVKLNPNDTDIIVEMKFVQLLEWITKTCPNAPPPSKAVLSIAFESKHFKVLKWYMSTYPEAEKTVRELVDAAALRGDIDEATQRLMMDLPLQG